MAFKFIIVSALLAVASAGYLAPATSHYVAEVANPAADAVALTHQNVVRSFGGTVSQYSKSVHTPYSSVHKEDTRVNNNVYTPAVAKTVTYAAPVVTKTVSYAHAPAPSVAPAAIYTKHSAPVVTKTVYAHPEPTHAVYASLAPQAVYTHEQPAHAVYASPVHTTGAAVYKHQHHVPSTATYNHGPSATTYTHNTPTVSAYGSSQTVRYSPAEMVSHMSFDGFGTHWGF